jgi:hypothetical protein
MCAADRARRSEDVWNAVSLPEGEPAELIEDRAPSDIGVFIPVPLVLRSILDALAAIPDREDERARWLDRTAPRLVTGIGAFVSEPSALLAAQRGLLLLAPRQKSSDALTALQAALQRVDQDLGDEGGFSRLLDAALNAGEVTVLDLLDADGIEGELKPLARVLQRAARYLTGLDDLSHALSIRADVAAAAVVVDCLRTLLGDEPPGLDEIQGWLREKATDPRIPTLLELWRGPRDAGLAERAVESLTGRDLALLLLLDGEPDRALMDALLAESGLAPAEVFDLADLLD